MNSSNRQRRIGALAVCIVAVLVGSVAASQEKLPKKYTETITTKTGTELSLEMVLIPGGTFLMGSPASEPGRKDDEGPQRKVALDPFYLCTTETTLELFMAYYQETGTAKKDFVDVQEAQKNAETPVAGADTITGPTPVYGDMTMGYSVKHPAMGLTWHNAMTFCQWLSQKTGKQYRLPTEAEWEYAARAGTTYVFGFGDDPEKLGDYAWYEDNADFGPSAVATKKPNAWGLYDMLGNVCEWVHDFYQPNGYVGAAVKNPKGPEEGTVHVARGGYYENSAEELRCAARAFEEPWWRMNDPQIPKSRWWLPQIDFVGFRVACSVPKD
ncbi:formylglycine-generating enzyme family protein [Anaerobaca lacustris]|uniref:SUMF1/EgtB/PvdO family nonheme iron enzyme n=1 Tax=Anaerobaca lacustris TaxID=3044600 RepID=A0AAW6TX68_9BACT|nr:SUMF1/EgtB/PvdO family nonheme iron enzyme [Sedimentisphaerales bacterium M17dextr]